MFTTTARRSVLALFAVAFVLLAACSSTSPDDAATSVEAITPVEGTTLVEPAAPGQVAPPAPVVVTPPAPETSTGNGGQGNGGQTGGGSETVDPPPPHGPAPVIDTFWTPEDVDCHNGMQQTFSAEWTTTHAVEVVISMDGHVPLGTFDPDGSASLPFDCSSSHSYKLTARSTDGQEAVIQITLDPRNVQPPAEDHDLGDATNDTATEESAQEAPEAP